MRTSGKSRIFKLAIQTINGDAALTRTTCAKQVLSAWNINIPGARAAKTKSRTMRLARGASRARPVRRQVP